MTKWFTILLLALAAGCSATFQHQTTSTLYVREIVLSGSHQQDTFLAAKLVAIADDGTTTIAAIPTGAILKASPGGYFVSSEYGEHGLMLVSASAEKHEAHFERTWCETK